MDKENFLDKLKTEIDLLEDYIKEFKNITSDKFLVYSILNTKQELEEMLSKLSRVTNNNWLWLHLDKDKYNLFSHFLDLIESLTKFRDIDFLTSLYNRFFFEKNLVRELEDAKKFRIPLSLLLFDIDDFKRINDTYGHDVGDKVLKEVAHTLKSKVRANDYACRIGGEEFAVILKGAGYKQSYFIANRILDSIGSKNIYVGDKTIKITLSGGGVVYPGRGEIRKEELFKMADLNLYKSKNTGKNKFYISIWIRQEKTPSSLVEKEEKNILFNKR